jgi:hypothetical protein
MATWSNYSIELQGYPDSLVKDLDKYVRAYRIGKFSDAQELYESTIAPSLPSYGILIIGRAEALRYETRWGQLVGLLDGCLTSEIFTASQVEYLSLMKALAEIYVFGSLLPALRKARKFRDDLGSTQWHELSIYQVR